MTSLRSYKNASKHITICPVCSLTRHNRDKGSMLICPNLQQIEKTGVHPFIMLQESPTELSSKLNYIGSIICPEGYTNMLNAHCGAAQQRS
jgi:hypothetical protein